MYYINVLLQLLAIIIITSIHVLTIIMYKPLSTHEEFPEFLAGVPGARELLRHTYTCVCVYIYIYI